MPSRASSMDRSGMEKRPAPERGDDIISSLPDECLSYILSLVDNSLPFERTHATIRPRIRHPVHCALICRRWAAVTNDAVERLQFRFKYANSPHFFDEDPEILKFSSVHSSLSSSLHRFPALRVLRFTNLYAVDLSSILGALARRACPRLEAFEFVLPRLGYSGNNHPDLDGAEMALAFRSCPLLREVVIRAEYVAQGKSLNLALRALPLLESLDVGQMESTHAPRAGEFLEGVHEGLTQLKSLCIGHQAGFDGNSPPLAASVGSLSTLERLTLTSGMFAQLPDSLRGLRGLRVLSLSCLWELESLPAAAIATLTLLERLEIVSCFSLQALPETIGQLSRLRTLCLYWCLNLQGLPASLGRLSLLEKLFIKDCPSVPSLPDSLGRLSALQKLTIRGLSLQHGLPESVCSLTALQKLSLDCDGMSALPETLGSLRSLTKLQLAGKGPSALPESLGQLARLEWLELEVTSLNELPASIGQLCKLTSLKIGVEVPLPETLGDLSELRCLTLCSCSHLPASIGQLEALEMLVLDHGRLASLPEAIGKLGSLRELSLLRWDELTVLPECMSKMPSLRQVVLTIAQDVDEGHPSLKVLKQLKDQGVEVLQSKYFDFLD